MPAKAKGRPAGTSTGFTLLSGLTGSQTAETALLFLALNGSGYAAEIERITGLNKTAVFAQFRRLENAGLLARQDVGRTAVFSFARQPLAAAFKNWVERIANELDDDERQRLAARRKPRATGKKISFGEKPPQEKV
jgi:hypothetical protein